MTTAAPSTALATIQPAFTDAERLALAGYLAGYRGLTREAYALDLRQFTAWCRAAPFLCSPSAAPTSKASPRNSKPGAAPARPSPGGCAPSPGSTSTRSRRSSGSIPGRACPPSAAGLRVACDRAGPQRAPWRAPGRRRTRPTSRACADLAARAERAARLRSNRRRYRASGPGARAPDADHHAQGRQSGDYSAGAAHGPGDRPGHREADRRAGVPGCGRASGRPARRRTDRPQDHPPAGISKVVTPHTLRHAFIICTAFSA